LLFYRTREYTKDAPALVAKDPNYVDHTEEKREVDLESLPAERQHEVFSLMSDWKALHDEKVPATEDNESQPRVDANGGSARDG
jgi:hypothetical protein